VTILFPVIGDPMYIMILSGGRKMKRSFCHPLVDENGEWLDLLIVKYLSDMRDCGTNARALGSAPLHQKLPRSEELKQFTHLSDNGNEVVL